MKTSDLLYYTFAIAWLGSLFFPLLQGWQRTEEPWEFLNWFLFSVHSYISGYRTGCNATTRPIDP